MVLTQSAWTGTGITTAIAFDPLARSSPAPFLCPSSCGFPPRTKFDSNIPRFFCSRVLTWADSGLVLLLRHPVRVLITTAGVRCQQAAYTGRWYRRDPVNQW